MKGNPMKMNKTAAALLDKLISVRYTRRGEDREIPDCPKVAVLAEALAEGREMASLVSVTEKREIDASEIPAMLVGALATVSIGSDSYAAVVVKASATLQTIEVRYTDGLKGLIGTFRATKYGYTMRKRHHLTLGRAREYTDPHF